MAKKPSKKQKSIEASLWESANDLPGSVEPSEYKHEVLNLIFPKYANDCFIERRDEQKAEGKEAFVDHAVLYLTERSQWGYLTENAKQTYIAIKIDTALSGVERENATLKGVLPSNYYSGLGLDQPKTSALFDKINKINTLKDREHDLVGRVYEYFLSKFAIAEGKGKGEDSAPKSIVNLIAENDYTLSVSSYVEFKDEREEVDIVKLNAEIAKTVKKIDSLRADIDQIVKELEE